MKQQVFSISPTNPEATLSSYLWERSDQQWRDQNWQPEKRPAVIICPGGAYRFLSDREAEPVAMRFYVEGFQTFILRYSLLEESAYPAPIEEASSAIWIVRSHAKEWGIDPDQIIIGGFSAGGHFSALAGTRWNEEGLANRLGIPEGGNKPNGLILCYGKLEPLPEGTDRLINDEEVGHALRVYDKRTDTIQNIGDHTPPAFIWHTRSDDLVPVEESMRFAARCQEKGVPFELHIYSEGAHGLSLGNDMSGYRYRHDTNIDTWVSLCIKWFQYLFDF